jgi:anaerobic selenocysteine-containing dehydrogenase
MTIRSEGQFNTVVYEEEDIFRKQKRRDIVILHPADMERLALQEDDCVTVQGTTGSLDVVVRRFEIAQGNCAMYYPEANILLSHDVDAESRTPLFNGELVQIIRRVDA